MIESLYIIRHGLLEVSAMIKLGCEIFQYLGRVEK